MANEITPLNHGKFKTELVAGLCSPRSSIRICYSSEVKIETKRLVSLFKYVFGYLMERQYHALVTSTCRPCNTKEAGIEHSCTTGLLDKEAKERHFYFIMNSVDKELLLRLFRKIATCAKITATPFCPCILYYKSLTVWRASMRKLFIQKRVPSGISKSVLSSFLNVVQEWERNGNN